MPVNSISADANRGSRADRCSVRARKCSNYLVTAFKTSTRPRIGRGPKRYSACWSTKRVATETPVSVAMAVVVVVYLCPWAHVVVSHYDDRVRPRGSARSVWRKHSQVGLTCPAQTPLRWQAVRSEAPHIHEKLSRHAFVVPHRRTVRSA